jgi:hypothetical protein
MSAIQPQIKRSVAILDVENTLVVNGKYNDNLIDELVSSGVRDVYLLMSMRLVDDVTKNREELIAHLTSKGLTVHDVMTQNDLVWSHKDTAITFVIEVYEKLEKDRNKTPNDVQKETLAQEKFKSLSEVDVSTCIPAKPLVEKLPSTLVQNFKDYRTVRSAADQPKYKISFFGLINFGYNKKQKVDAVDALIDSFYGAQMGVSKSVIEDMVQELNDSVDQKARLNNRLSEELIRDLSNNATYVMPEVDKNKTEIYRHGFCGEACDAVLTVLKDSVSIESLEKVQPNPQHFYLADKDSDLIIDPTYKQYFYKLLIDTNTGAIKENVREEQISIIDNMPSIFVGSLTELKTSIVQTLNTIEKSLEEKNTLEIWNIPVSLEFRST